MFHDAATAAAGDGELAEFRRSEVGIVFQFYNLVRGLAARENVALVTEIAADPMLSQQALDLKGLTPRMDHVPSQLSGGEQQRVAVGRAIATRPDVPLCEPLIEVADPAGLEIVADVLSADSPDVTGSSGPRGRRARAPCSW